MRYLVLNESGRMVVWAKNGRVYLGGMVFRCPKCNTSVLELIPGSVHLYVKCPSCSEGWRKNRYYNWKPYYVDLGIILEKIED